MNFVSYRSVHDLFDLICTCSVFYEYFRQALKSYCDSDFEKKLTSMVPTKMVSSDQLLEVALILLTWQPKMISNILLCCKSKVSYDSVSSTS